MQTEKAVEDITQIAKHYVTVDTKEKVEELIEVIQGADVIAYDTETTSLNMRTGKIIGFSVSTRAGNGYYLPSLVWNTKEEKLDRLTIGGVDTFDISKKVLQLLIGKKLICHNGSFDMRYTTNFFGVDLLSSLWVDTALLVHTVQEEGAGMGVFGLKALAISVQEEIGLDVSKAANEEQLVLKESIKRNGGGTSRTNFEMFKADLDILSKYAAADTDLTYRLCFHFLKVLEAEGLSDFFFKEEVMPIYREVTIPMEIAGVSLDMELLTATHLRIKKDLAENKDIVLKSLLATSEAKQWVLDTALREYPVNNKGTWAQTLVARYSLPLPRSEKSGKYSLTAKNIEELEDSVQKQFLLTGDKTLIDEVESARISMSLWKEKNDGDYINIQSKSHVGEIVFKYMGIKAMSQTKKGQDQFDMGMLEFLSKDYPWAENLRVYNKLLKIKSTYIDRFLDKAENGVYYAYFKQHGTVSGRYSSDLQQLPKPKEEGEDAPIIVEYINLVRAFLIAGKGRKFIDADYESLEPHVLASITEDQNLRDIFNNGWDFYSTIAIKTEKLEDDKRNYPNGVSPDKKSPVFLKKLNVLARNTAKAYALGIPYGMGAFALGKSLNIPQKEAKKLVDGYLNGFPQLQEWMENSREQVKAHGYIKTKVGRIRHLPKAKKIYDKFGEKILDWKFRKNLEGQYGKAQVMQVYRDYKNSLNNCLNVQLQGYSASIVNRAALQINRKATKMGIDAVVIAQIHDQIVVSIEEGRAEEFAPIVSHIMETTTELPGVTLKAPPEIADNMQEGH